MEARKRWIVFVAALVAAGPACAADDDAAFAKQAASDGMLEVELGSYAATNAADPEVKRFGRMMVDEHSRANQQLEQIAGREGIRLQSSMTEAHRERATKLMSLHGAEFDEAYVEAMVGEHEEAVKQFSEQAEQNRSEVDQWAARILPALRHHLAQAKELESKRGERVSRNP